MQRTLVLIKPDGVKRALMGEIIKRFEQRGFKIVGMKMVWIDDEFASTHYAEHVGKSFFDELLTFITSSPVLAFVVEGVNAIKGVRKIVGATNPEDSVPGTIRGDFAHSLVEGQNLIHASANVDDASKEIKLWFKPEELHSYSRSDEKHVLGKK